MPKHIFEKVVLVMYTENKSRAKYGKRDENKKCG
jgi:hypothetical protein